MTRHARIATTLFFLVSLPLFFTSSGERSPYVRTFVTFPPAQAAFGVFGYNYTLADGPVFAENAYYFDQSLMFSGSPAHRSLYFTSVRPVYAFLASIFAPFAGVIGALALMNYLAWGIAAWAAWRLTMRLSAGDSFAALLSVVFVACGLGFVIHAHDYSPHLVPFTSYYLGVLAVFESRVALEARQLRTHLALGLALALACVTYSMGIALVLGYALVSLRRNRWVHVGAGFAIAITSQYVWTTTLNVLNSLVTGQLSWTNVQGAEQGFLTKSLGVWSSTLGSPLRFLEMLADGLFQFAWFECAPIALLGLISWIFLPWRHRFFHAVFFGLPFAIGLAFVNASTTRGYLVYGTSILVYVPLAVALSRQLSAAAGARRFVVMAAIALVFLVQLGWSSSYIWGYVMPAKMFFGFGYTSWIPTFLTQWQLPPAMSLTGSEATAVMFGGSAALPEAGMRVVANAPAAPKLSMFFALASRAVLTLYALLLCVLAFQDVRRRKVAIAAVALGLWILPSFIPQILPPRPPPIGPTFYGIHVPAGQTWRYSVEIGEPFLERMRERAADADAVEIMFPGLRPPFVTVASAGSVQLVHATDGRAVLRPEGSVAEVLYALESSRRLEIAITTPADGDGTAVFGWQRSGLHGRALSSDPPWTGATLPACELRLLDASGRPILIGF